MQDINCTFCYHSAARPKSQPFGHSALKDVFFTENKMFISDDVYFTDKKSISWLTQIEYKDKTAEKISFPLKFRQVATPRNTLQEIQEDDESSMTCDIHLWSKS
jgi:hypothetical protein